MYTITKECKFHAAHRLKDMPEGHPCKNLHGHSYKVFITVATGRLDSEGLSVDFGVLGDIIAKYDHQFLGGGHVVVDGVELVAVLGDLPSTAEVLATHIGSNVQSLLDRMNEDGPPESEIVLVEVAVWETDTAVVRFSP